MPGVYNASIYSINSEGIRGKLKIDSAALKILTIGGSTTECLYLDDSEEWPHLLQSKLNERGRECWVGNIGRSGLNSVHHIIEIEQGIDQYGELDVITFLVGINDLMKDINHSQGIYLDQQSDFQKTFLVYPIKDSLPFVKKLELYQLVRKVVKGNELKNLNQVQDEEGLSYVKWRRNRKNAIKLLDTVPSLENELLEYRKHIHTIIELCIERNIEPLFLLQPTMYSDSISSELKNLLWLGGLGDFQGDDECDYYSVRVLNILMKKYNDIVRTVCQENNVQCIDLTKHLPSNTNVFYDDCHFNENGAEMVAEIVARYFNKKNKLSE